MEILDILLRVWSVILIIGAFIPFLREQTWWLRAWTYARLQILVLVTVTLIPFYIYLAPIRGFDAIIFGGLILAAASCLRDIFPFTKLGLKQVQNAKNQKPQIDVKMMVGNVLMENEHYADYLEQIKSVSPDIVFLVETNEAWREKLSDLETLYPHTYLLPLEDFNGMLFYSRFPIQSVLERYLVQDYIPSLTLDLDIGYTQNLKLYGVHPRPPRPEDDTSDLDKELRLVAGEVGHSNLPTIVTGDLNDVGWSSTTKRFLRLSGLLDPRHGRGLFNSYNAKNLLVRWPLDHVFHSNHFRLKEMKRLEPCGSDHFPILIELAIEKLA